MLYSKIFRAARANLLRVGKNFWRKTHEKLMIYLKNFPRCARQFVKNFIFWKFWSQNGTKNMSDQWFSQKFDGGDVDENRHFIDGKWVAHGQKIRYFENFDHKMAIFF